jgi:hypothetical protein
MGEEGEIVHAITMTGDLLLGVAGLICSIAGSAILLAWKLGGKISCIETLLGAFASRNHDDHEAIIESLRDGSERLDDHGNRISTLEERTKDGC